VILEGNLTVTDAWKSGNEWIQRSERRENIAIERRVEIDGEGFGFAVWIVASMNRQIKVAVHRCPENAFGQDQGIVGVGSYYRESYRKRNDKRGRN